MALHSRARSRASPSIDLHLICPVALDLEHRVHGFLLAASAQLQAEICDKKIRDVLPCAGAQLEQLGDDLGEVETEVSRVGVLVADLREYLVGVGAGVLHFGHTLVLHLYCYYTYMVTCHVTKRNAATAFA